MTDRVTSFSVPPGDLKALEQVRKLKKYCEETGTSFSHLVVRGITMVNKELGLDNGKDQSNSRS